MKKALIIMIAAFVALSCVFANGQTESVYPSQGIEFVIPASAGGGSGKRGACRLLWLVHV